jgi:hypothetical protein
VDSKHDFEARFLEGGTVMSKPLSSTIVNQTLINEGKPRSLQKPTNIPRRTLIQGVLGGVLAGLLSSPGRVIAQGRTEPNDPFLLLLKGVYQSVVKVPDLGLTVVQLDSTFSFTQIRAVTRIPGSRSDDNAVVGNFYVQLPPKFTPNLVAYDLPGGAIAMQFTAEGGFTKQIPDGQGGFYLEGTFELPVLEATGIYSSFAGGHNHMVDRLHLLANGRFDENCYCIISLPNSLPLWWSSN